MFYRTKLAVFVCFLIQNGASHRVFFRDNRFSFLILKSNKHDVRVIETEFAIMSARSLMFRPCTSQSVIPVVEHTSIIKEMSLVDRVLRALPS